MAEFQQQIRNRTTLIVVLLILVLAAQAAFFIFGSKNSEAFQKDPTFLHGLFSRQDHPQLAPLGADTAQQWVDKYRGNLALTQLSFYKKTKGLYHDSAGISHFINVFYPDFAKGHTPMPGYMWRIGMSYFVCMRTDADNVKRPKMSFVWLPVMVNQADTTKVLDYFGLKGTPDTSYYYLPNKSAGTALSGEPPFIYDAGTLWP